MLASASIDDTKLTADVLKPFVGEVVFRKLFPSAANSVARPGVESTRLTFDFLPSLREPINQVLQVPDLGSHGPFTRIKRALQGGAHGPDVIADGPEVPREGEPERHRGAQDSPHEHSDETGHAHTVGTR